MATATDIITAAFIKVGVETPTAAQNASALISLNNMVSLLGAEGLIYSITSEALTVNAGEYEYTIGSGADWDTVRPLKVLSCFLRDDDNYDWPVNIIGSKDYNIRSNKTFTARPTELYYLPEYTVAKVIFNTSPDAAYDAYFEFLKNFTEFATGATTVALPNEYKEALVYNLAVSLGEDWDRKVAQSVLMNAARTREIIDRLNASVRVTSRAKFDFAGLGGTSDSGYSVVTDEYIDGGAF